LNFDGKNAMSDVVVSAGQPVECPICASLIDGETLIIGGVWQCPYCNSTRPFGLCGGQFTVPADFDQPLSDDILKDFEG
jgi:ribosomal protein L37AE/L43A